MRVSELVDLVRMPVPVPDLRGRRVLVTGAAGGIGRATAQLAAQRGAQVVITDRNAADLAETARLIGQHTNSSAVLHSEPGDITDHEWVADLAHRVHRDNGPLDVVANVAGISAWGTVENMTHETWRALVEVNLMGPIHVIEEFVPQMIAGGGGGHVVNVSSAAGLMALPWHGGYSATKFGLFGLSEVLRYDLRRHGIGVSVVCPGAVDTPMVQSVQIAGFDRDNPAIEKSIGQFHRIAVSPESAARSILDGVTKNKFLVYTSFDVRFGYWWKRKFAPPYEIAMRVANNRFDTLGRISAREQSPRGAAVPDEQR